jgi:hypothetical protein
VLTAILAGPGADRAAAQAGELGPKSTGSGSSAEVPAAQRVVLSDDDGYQLVDMVVAEVDSAVITYSELIAEARLALLARRGLAAARESALSLELLRAVLRSVIARNLLLAEARRLQLRDVSRDEVERSLAELRGPFPSQAAFVDFMAESGFTVTPEIRETDDGAPAELLSILRSRLLVDRFIELRLRPNVLVTPSAARACFEANQRLFPGNDFKAARPVVEQTLRAQLEDKALRELLEQLANQSQMRFAPNFEVSATGPAAQVTDPMALRCPMPER